MVITMLSHLVHFIAVGLIIVSTAVIGYFILAGMHEDVNPIMPVIIYVFIGWMTAKLFVGTFGLAVDATLQCFIAAEEMGCGDECAPEKLRGFIQDTEAEKGMCDSCCCTVL